MPVRAIKSIFFTRFHHEKGSRVLHQVPEGSITPSSSPSALTAPLFDFDSVTTYLIPTQQFCDRLLTFVTNHHRIIGYPVCIREGRYSRNEFIFNFAVVIDENVKDWVAYGEVVRKLGRLLRGLEEQGGFVSREEDEGIAWRSEEDEKDGFGSDSKVYALCEMVLEDLNNYAECMIPIDDSNTINLKLFPTHPPPPPIHPFHVPLLTISLESLTSPLSSDLTLLRILPFINGVNSVSHIAQLADTDLSLTRKAIQHLVYYGCLILLDIFSFSAVYAPTAEIGAFIASKNVMDECRRYVHVPRSRYQNKNVEVGSQSSIASGQRRERESISSETSQTPQQPQQPQLSTPDIDSLSTNTRPSPSPIPSGLPTQQELETELPDITLIALYTTLRQGLPLKTWVLDNLALLHNIDIRRFITFGVIKGFLYRIHKYAISTANPQSAQATLPPAPPTSLQSQALDLEQEIANFNLSSQAHGHGDRHSSTAHHRDTLSNVRASLAAPATSKPHDPHRPSIASSTTTINPLPHTTPHAAPEAPSAHPTTHKSEGLARLELRMLEEERERERARIEGGGLPLVRFLDGAHSFDEICTELGRGERVVEERLRGVGDVVFVMR